MPQIARFWLLVAIMVLGTMAGTRVAVAAGDTTDPAVPPPSKPAVTETTPTAPATPGTGVPKDELGNTIAGILGELDDRWTEVFKEQGQSYKGPRIVLFRNATNGGRCGMVQSETGPFYCAADRLIYLDPGHFRDVEIRYRACSGDTCKFATAFLIAREAGHHIQNLMGILPRVQRLQEQAPSKTAANALQVRVELQADCLSGVWFYLEEKKRPGFLEAGGLEAALATAEALGDDTLQRQSTGRVVPDSFTRGSAAQRKQWFTTGYKEGTLAGCNTFAAGAL